MNIGMIFKGDIRYESNECVLYLYDILNYILEYILLGKIIISFDRFLFSFLKFFYLLSNIEIFEF